MPVHSRARGVHLQYLVILVASALTGCFGGGGGNIKWIAPPPGPVLEFPPESRTPVEIPLKTFGEVRLPKVQGAQDGIGYTLACGAERRTLPGFEIKVDDDGPLLVGQAPAAIDPPITCRLIARDGEGGRGETSLYVRTTPEGPPVPLSLGSSGGDIDLGTLPYRASMTPKDLVKATGGTPDYTYDFKCAGEKIEGVEVDPASPVDGNVMPVLIGKPEEPGKFRCTLSVTDESSPPTRATRGIKLEVEPGWSLGNPSGEKKGTCAASPVIPTGSSNAVALPVASGGSGSAKYGHIASAGSSWTTDPAAPGTGAATAIELRAGAKDGQTYLYLVSGAVAATTTNAHDGVCAYGVKESCPTDEDEPTTLDGTQWVLRLTAAEYGNAGWSCPTLSEGAQGTGATENSATGGAIAGVQTTNPVHTALLPAQGAQWGEVVHDAIGEHIGAWARGETDGRLAGDASFASPAGDSDGWRWSGDHQSAGATAGVAVGDWLIGVHTRGGTTALDYVHTPRNDPRYVSGEHQTDIMSVHPWIAWRGPEDGVHGWASAGAGTGELSHRDGESPIDAFRKWSHAPLRIETVAAGGGAEIGSLGDGRLHASGRVDRYRISTSGGGAISKTLPASTGTQWRAAMDWRGAGEGLHPRIGGSVQHAGGAAPGGSRIALTAGIEPWLGRAKRIRLRAVGTLRRSIDGEGRSDRALDLGLVVHPRHDGRGLSASLGVGRTTTREEGLEGGSATLGLETAYRLRVVEPFVRMARSEGDSGGRTALGMRLHRTDVDRLSVTAEHEAGRETRVMGRAEHRF